MFSHGLIESWHVHASLRSKYALVLGFIVHPTPLHTAPTLRRHAAAQAALDSESGEQWHTLPTGAAPA